MNLFLNKQTLKNNRKIIALVKFLSIYLGVIVVYYWVVTLDNNPMMDLYVEFTSYLSSKLISLFDSSVISNKQMISGKSFQMVLSFGCEGSEPITVFLAGIVAYPALFKSKLIGLAFGIPILYVINIIRILFLYYLGLVFPAIFDICHTTIFPILFIVLSISMWLLWIKKYSN